MLSQIYLFAFVACVASAIEFQCPDNSQTFYKHPKSCEKFIECNHGMAEEVDCFAGTYFNPLTNYCDFPENVECIIEESVEIPEPEPEPQPDNGPVGTCPDNNDGFVAFLTDASDCTVFYMCNWGTPIRMGCPGGLHFNPILNVCDYPEDAGCM
uniref:Peritrophin n=1 Tax=Popillia japonica TaxID=7064 RepID=C0LL31_POPJA|nr:peritrophin [Popillia japonica]